MGSGVAAAAPGTPKQGANLGGEFSCKPRTCRPRSEWFAFHVGSFVLLNFLPRKQFYSCCCYYCIFFFLFFFCKENLLARSFLSLSDVIFLLPFMMPRRVIETLWLSLPCRRCFLRLSP